MIGLISITVLSLLISPSETFRNPNPGVIVAGAANAHGQSGDDGKTIGIIFGIAFGVPLGLFILFWACIFSYIGLHTCYEHLCEHLPKCWAKCRSDCCCGTKDGAKEPQEVYEMSTTNASLRPEEGGNNGDIMRRIDNLRDPPRSAVALESNATEQVIVERAQAVDYQGTKVPWLTIYD